MRAEPKYSAELVSQALMGTPVKLLEREGAWWKAQTPDGYKGWIRQSSITEKSTSQMAEWRKSRRLVYTAVCESRAFLSPEAISPREAVSDLVNGDIVGGVMNDTACGHVAIILPDGRKAWADKSAFTPIEKWANQNFDADKILDTAYSLTGLPYLWGGASTKGTDCSGLVRVAYFSNGYILMRDASQQARTGQNIPVTGSPAFQKADLLFFGEKPGGRVTHVGIYDADNKFIHSSGRIFTSSLDPESEIYAHRILLGATRIHGHEGSQGITLVRDHPWYF